MQPNHYFDWSVVGLLIACGYLPLCAYMFSKTWRQEQIARKIREQLKLRQDKA